MEATTVRAARAAFFARNGFPADGGYDEAWSQADFGALHYAVPNSDWRRRALRLHDLHHVVTGYGIDWRGESEISAWELGSGAGRQPWAWVIALWGLFVGITLLPIDTFRAFVRGRRSTNLYPREFADWLLDVDTRVLAAELGVVPREAAWGPDVTTRDKVADVLAFSAWSTAATAWGLLALPPTAAFAAIGVARAYLDLPCPLCPTS